MFVYLYLGGIPAVLTARGIALGWPQPTQSVFFYNLIIIC